MNRKLNFNAGPAALPSEVLQELSEQMVSYQGEGISMIENSHRGKSFDVLYHETLDLFREVLNIPEGYSLFFLGGGATLQFGMVPMNFLPPEGHADYLRTGAWSDKAVEDAEKIGSVKLTFDGKPERYTTMPEADQVTASRGASYVYLCSNETIEGVRWVSWPDTGSVPLIADMSSDILSRPLPIDRFSMIFAGTQKNLGPAGATLIIISDELAAQSNKDLPAYLNYQVHSTKDGLLNTPSVFTIWATKLVLQWVKRHGGAEGMEKRAEKKSAMIYDAVDESGGFYRCPAQAEYRSTMNVVFRLPDEQLEKQFVAEAQQRDMVGLKGHRSVGGCRASIYNAVPEEAVGSLAAFMKEFARNHG